MATKGDNRTLSRFARTNAAQKKKVVRVISEQSVQDALHAVDNREQALDNYLNRTLLKKRLVDAMRELVHLDYLPRNPYTFLVPHMRQQEIQNELAGRRVVGLLNKVVPGLPATQYVTSICDNFDHYGTSLLLKQVDVEALTELSESLRGAPGCFIDHVSGEYGGEGKEPHVKAISCVVAPTIFYGNTLPYIEKICINHDYFCCAKKFEQGTRAYAGEIIRNLFEFKNSGKSISEGIYVVQSPKTRGGIGEPRLWTHHEIQTSRQSFIRNVKEAVTGKRDIYVNGMVWLTLGANHGFQKSADAARKLAAGAEGSTGGGGKDGGKKKKTKKIVGGGLLARAALKQQQVKAAEKKTKELQRANGCFYAIQKNYLFHYKEAGSADAAEAAAAKEKGKKGKKGETKVADNQNSAAGYRAFVAYPYQSLATGLYEKRQDAEYYASAWGGPKPGEQSYNRLIKPYKSKLMHQIATCHHEGDWVAMYEMLLTIIVWNEGGEAALMSQIFNSLVGQMRQLSIEARTMRDVLSRCLRSSEELAKFSSNLLKEYSVFYQRVSKLIGGTAIIDAGGGSGGSSASILSSLKLMMRARLAATVDLVTKRLKLEASSVRNLDALSRTFRVIELSVAADAVPLFQDVQSLVKRTVAEAEDAATAKEKDEKKQGSANKSTGKLTIMAKKQQKVDDDKKKVEDALVIDVMQETRRYKANNKFPSKVLREATIMQYLVDSRVDTTIEQMYQQLLSEPLYPNPYPRVTIILQSAWARHEFWRRSDSDMLNELMSVKPTLISQDTLSGARSNTSGSSATSKDESIGSNIGTPYTYVARGGNESAVWGTLASVRICDPKNLCQLYACLPELKNRTDISQHMRNNKEVICMGFAGRTALEFRICEHDEALPSFLECHEHYIITGTQARTAIRLFVEHVIKYSQWLHIDTPHLVTILSTGQIDPNTGNTGTRANFSVADLKKGSAAIRRELIRAANSNDGIFLHGLMRLDKPYSERFILMRKWFFFHWRDPSTNNSLEKQSYLAPSALQQCIFFSSKEASTVIGVIQEKLPVEGDARDPMSPKSIGEYVGQLKRNVGRKMMAGDVLDAYHEMVPLVVVENRMDQLTDLTRMLTSTAELVRDATFENRVLQELVSGLSQEDSENSFKGKVSLDKIKEQVKAHRTRCKAILSKSGDTFVAGAQGKLIIAYCVVFY
jgi:hypothetical protein